jgi:hypothetical protein
MANSFIVRHLAAILKHLCLNAIFQLNDLQLAEGNCCRYFIRENGGVINCLTLNIKGDYCNFLHY